jgi:beta-glucosidase
MATKPLLRFPKDFLWGAATSAHQVEGNQANNWTEWEKKNADKLARGSKKAFDTPAVHWYRIKDQAMDPQNYLSGPGVDHFNRFEQDFDIAKSLNHNAHRFSLEWSRIEPERGHFDEAAIKHYHQVLTALIRRGIEPMVTLWHFSLPNWVEERGGFTNPMVISDFERYVARMVQEFGADVKYWCTINEPEVFSSFSYWLGYWPPRGRNPATAFAAYTSLLPRAHIRAYKVIKRHSPHAKVGISKNMMWYAADGKILAPFAASLWNWFGNYYFLDQIKNYQDYVGLNYYFKYVFRGLTWRISEQNPSDMGWGLHPDGLQQLLKMIGKRYKHTPIIITECGLADSQDESRAWYIKELLRNVHSAMQAGVDVRGFMYWALLDNFEWDKGYWPKFGLVEVDRRTMKRTARPSARVYAEIIKAGGLD